MNKDSKIFIAGHTGMVGSSFVRRLKNEGYMNLVTRSHSELELTDQSRIKEFFLTEHPDYVILAAGKAGGIMANNSYPAEFIYSNLQILSNVIHHSWLANVRKLLLIACSCPPHKPNRAIASPEERLEMLRVATGGDPRFEVSDAETRRGGVSYTIDTLRYLKARQPETRFFLILGNDAFAEIATWKDYEHLFKDADFAIMLRGGYSQHEVMSRVPLGIASGLADASYVDCAAMGAKVLERRPKLIVVQVPQIEISGSLIRKNIMEQRSVQYLMPEAVLDYIEERGLYQ